MFKTKTGYFLVSTVIAVIIGCICTILAGCGIGVLVGGEVQSYSSDYRIALENPRQDIFAIITDVGKSMDYRVESMSARHGSIVLESEPSFFQKEIVGKIGGATISINVANNGRGLYVDIHLCGNFGIASQENADKIFNDFKGKLLEKLK